MNQEQKNYLDEVQTTIERLANVCAELRRLWERDDRHGIDLNQFLTKEYPYAESFEETATAVETWLNSYKEQRRKIEGDTIENEFRNDFEIIPAKKLTYGDIIERQVFALDLRDGSEFLLNREHDVLRLIESGNFLFVTEK